MLRCFNRASTGEMDDFRPEPPGSVCYSMATVASTGEMDDFRPEPPGSVC